MGEDEMLIATQNWLVSTYGNNNQFTINVPTDGTGRGITIKALIQALQIELEVNADGIWGNNTANAFDNLFPNGLSEQTEVNSNQTIINIIYIIQGGFYTSRGISPGGLDGAFGSNLKAAVQAFQGQAGVSQSGIVKAYLLKAILTTDSFLLVTNGDSNIRQIQMALNNNYGETIGLIATNGLYLRTTNKALIKAIQIEVNATYVDGLWGEDTMSRLPTLRRYGSNSTQMVYILQYLLYLNGYNPNGFDGGFGAGVQSAVRSCQQDYNLTVDGVCGRQTWASLIVSCGDTSRAALACDTRFELTSDKLQYLYNNGYRIVGRYLTGGNFKQLRPGEPQRILDAGLSFFPIFQESGTDVTYFTASNGEIDALSAKHAAKKHGIESQNVIYFAVDFDATDDEIDQYIIPYFQHLKAKISSTEDSNVTYKVGVYGTRKVCKALLINNLVVTCFVSDMSTGYDGNLGQTIPSNWTFDQFKTINNIETSSGTWAIDVVAYNTNSNFQPVTQLGTPGLAGHCTIRNGVDKYYLGTAKEIQQSQGQLFNVLSNKMKYHIKYNLSSGEESDLWLQVNLYEYGNNQPIATTNQFEPGQLYESADINITNGVDKYFTYFLDFFTGGDENEEPIGDVEVYISTLTT